MPVAADGELDTGVTQGPDDCGQYLCPHNDIARLDGDDDAAGSAGPFGKLRLCPVQHAAGGTDLIVVDHLPPPSLGSANEQIKQKVTFCNATTL